MGPNRQHQVEALIEPVGPELSVLDVLPPTPGSDVSKITLGKSRRLSAQ